MNPMMFDLLMFLLGQSIIILGAIIVAHVSTKVSIAELKVGQKTLQGDHTRLSGQVQGISRAVGRLEGKTD